MGVPQKGVSAASAPFESLNVWVQRPDLFSPGNLTTYPLLSEAIQFQESFLPLTPTAKFATIKQCILSYLARSLASRRLQLVPEFEKSHGCASSMGKAFGVNEKESQRFDSWMAQYIKPKFIGTKRHG